MRMKLETEVMREKAREARAQKRLEATLRVFALIFSFCAGMTLMALVMNPDANGAGWAFAFSFIGAVVCWVNGEPRRETK